VERDRFPRLALALLRCVAERHAARQVRRPRPVSVVLGSLDDDQVTHHVPFARVARPHQTVANEVRRLQTGDLVSIRTVGRSKLVRADAASPCFGPLAQLALMSFGPPLVVREEFARLPGVEQVFIFGSWAARYAGEAGPAPNDVDVLLVGTPIGIRRVKPRSERKTA
jgi:hypothetical protein